MTDKTSSDRHILKPGVLIGTTFLLAAVCWAYWEAMTALAMRWWQDPDYQYGFLVPAFGIVLLWLRRSLVPPAPWTGSLWAIGFFCLAGTMKWASEYFFITLLEPLSLIPCLVGVALLVGGWPVLRWTWPSTVFLTFMVPLPGMLGDLLGHPLQRIGTVASTYIIQMVGIPAVAQGNIILLAESEIGVVEACNGLRMLMLFITVCVGAAFVVQRTWLEKVIVILSAVPIAVLANIARITTTATMYQLANAELAQAVFHDLAGWFMMPLAVVMLWLEMAVLSKVLVDDEDVGPVPLAVSGNTEARLPGQRPGNRTARSPLARNTAKAPSKRRVPHAPSPRSTSQP